MTNNERLQKLGNAVRAHTGIGWNVRFGFIKRHPQKMAKPHVMRWFNICYAHNLPVWDIPFLRESLAMP